MTRGKKKSSGWKPVKQRGPWQERWARLDARHLTESRRECDKLRLWRFCPAKRCKRVRGCTGDPRRCMEQNRVRSAPPPDVSKPAPAATPANPARPALSAAEGAALIAASVAAMPRTAEYGFEEIHRAGHVDPKARP